MNSAIYRGTVRHRRNAPLRHTFRYRLFMMYLDLDELPQLFDGRWLWSARRPAPAWFRREDYLGPPDLDLAEAARRRAHELTGHRPEGPVRMLTHLRYLGYVQNPVTFYYCFDRNGVTVDTILAEITNTPWGERHVYALRAVDSSDGVRRRFAKEFHISPFMEMDHDYVWRFTPPGDRLLVHMENHRSASRVFDATLTLRRVEISGRSLAAALVRFPFMTARVGLGIYWQALRLRMKGAPYHEHPGARRAA